MKHISLFSGVGGFNLACDWLGIETIVNCEIDEFCQKVLLKHWPDVPIVKDVNNVDEIVSLCYNSSRGDEMGAYRKDFDNAIQLYQRGFSIQDVADYYNITRQAMWKILKRRGVVMRPNLKYGEDNHFWRGTTDNDKAQNLVESAIAKGLIIPLDHCGKCGANYRMADGRRAIQGHHDDYNKPLEVRWLCQKCHHEWHENNKAIPLKEVSQTEASRQDDSIILTAGFP